MYGVEATDSDWVLAAPFRAHLRWLLEATGVPWRVVALLAGMPADQIRHLLFGREGRKVRRLRRVCAARILSLTVPQVRNLSATIVAAGPTTERIGRLLAVGITLAEVAVHLDVPIDEARALATGQYRSCRRITELRAEAACQARGIRREADQTQVA